MFNSLEKSIIERLSGDIPLSVEPYKVIANELGITEELLLDKIKEFSDKGIIRRVGGILYHREAGFKANAMVVWVVPEKLIEKVADVACSFKEVTHCYKRPVYPNWPYNLFTMVHAENKEKCEEIIRKISKEAKIYDYKILYSTKELKKSSMKYFVEDNKL